MTDTTPLAPTDAEQPAPCPFCGHIGLDFAEGTTFRWIVASCEGCGSTRGETRIQTLGEGTRDEWMADARRDAITEWNRRAPAPAPTDAEIEELLISCGMRWAERSFWQLEDADLHPAIRAVLAKWGAPAPASGDAVSPFGYFRAEPFGWTDCAESDEGAKPLYEKPQAHSDLHAAAQALVDRWDTPKWKDADHTGAFIQRLREALAAPPAQEARVPLSEEQIFKAYTTATGKKLLKQGPARPGLLQIFRLAEAAHGITAAQKETP